jgi:hypothetical protein
MAKASSKSTVTTDSALFRIIVILALFSYCVISVLLFHLEQEIEDPNNEEWKIILGNANHVIAGGGATSSGKAVDFMGQEIRDDTNHKEDGQFLDALSESNDKITNLKGNERNEIVEGKKEKDNISENNDRNDKSKIIQILQQSGVEVTPEIEEKLPTWKEITSIYGDKPIIYGLETCPNFQSIVPVTDAYIGGSGMFNTGTNLLADLLLKYCKLPQRQVTPEQRRKFDNKERFNSGMLWHVPWGKHNPVSWRGHHEATVGGRGIDQNNVLPVVMIKDPYHWMSSMCRHPYAAKWVHRKSMCPHLLNNNGKPNTVDVPYRQDKHGTYDSLVGLWNTWYGDYLAVDTFPRLIIRYEDLLFHLEEVLTEVCHCGGGLLINYEEHGFVLGDENAKANHNNGSNGLLGAMLRYGFDSKRVETFTKDDVNYAKKALRQDMMQIFSFSYPKNEI